MRVPISIEAGTGVSLAEVRGLHPLAVAALTEGLLHVTYLPFYVRYFTNVDSELIPLRLTDVLILASYACLRLLSM